jgi:hypothetical protein
MDSQIGIALNDFQRAKLIRDLEIGIYLGFGA